MAYLLDANVFMSAQRLHYAFDFCPAFWEWLIRANAQRKVFSIEKVAGEIARGDDELVRWAADRGEGFFLPEDSSILPALGRVSAWATGKRYKPAAVTMFLNAADYYLVAYALAHKHTVVTHEVARDSLHSIKIPNACIDLDLKFMNPYEMLRRERARFVLDG